MRTIAFLLALASLAPAQTPAPPSAPAPAPSPEPHQEFFGAHIQRSMTLLATSSKERRWPVKVLIYGQSITGSTVLTKLIESNLRERFPDADLTLENRSIGGFQADRLVRTAYHDLYPFYPDLLIFHVYAGEKTGDLERIISNVRRYTAADIVLFNHHQTRDGKADLEFAPKYFRYLAQKYDCELVEVSTQWPRYLEENHFEPGRMLRDNVHPNEDGLKLLTALIARHLQYNPLFPAPSGMNKVRWYEAKRALAEGASDEIALEGPWTLLPDGVSATAAGAVLRLRFDGNRIDLIAARSSEKPGTARILIDGKAPSLYAGLYRYSLPGKGPQTWFPAIRSVRSAALPLVEDWTLRVTGINEDASRIRFQVTGSKTGPDGEGNSWERFVSNSKRVTIDPDDWMLAPIMKIFKQTAPPPVGYEIKWSTLALFTDTYQPPATPEASRVYATTLAQGLPNGPHTIEIIANGDGPLPIEALQVYQPPMR